MTNNLENLKNYFCTEHEKKIFCTKLCVKGKCFDILYDYDKKHEIDNFVSNFSEYLPYYVYNADTLECIDTEGDLSTILKEISKKCWNGPNVPSRNKNVNGIFGEVFLDFYERIVKKATVACTYASRRDFNSNYENKGYDNVLFRINNDVCVNCVFFAIFKNKSVNPSDYVDAYDSIYSEAEKHLKNIGFKNYYIEIVFIPTKSKSTEIKGAINEYYK